jgi:hypothetical protein
MRTKAQIEEQLGVYQKRIQELREELWTIEEQELAKRSADWEGKYYKVPSFYSDDPPSYIQVQEIEDLANIYGPLIRIDDGLIWFSCRRRIQYDVLKAENEISKEEFYEVYYKVLLEVEKLRQ